MILPICATASIEIPAFVEPTLTEEQTKFAQERLIKALDNYDWKLPIRSLAIRGADLVTDNIPIQMDLFMNERRREKQEKLDACIDEIRRRFGYFSIQKAFMLQDPALAGLDAMGSHTVHPIGFFNGR